MSGTDDQTGNLLASLLRVVGVLELSLCSNVSMQPPHVCDRRDEVGRSSQTIMMDVGHVIPKFFPFSAFLASAFVATTSFVPTASAAAAAAAAAAMPAELRRVC